MDGNHQSATWGDRGTETLGVGFFFFIIIFYLMNIYVNSPSAQFNLLGNSKQYCYCTGYYKLLGMVATLLFLLLFLQAEMKVFWGKQHPRARAVRAAMQGHDLPSLPLRVSVT